MHTLASVSNALPVGAPLPRLDIRFQTIQFYPYRAGLAVHQPFTSSVDHCVISMLLFPQTFQCEGKPLTQEHSSLFFLAAPGIPSCATRRTLSTGRRSRFCAYETCSVFRCPFVPYRVHYPLSIEESVWGMVPYPVYAQRD